MINYMELNNLKHYFIASQTNQLHIMKQNVEITCIFKGKRVVTWESRGPGVFFKGVGLWLLFKL